MARRALALASGLALTLALLGAALASRHRSEALPRLGRLPAFTLTAHDGRPLTLESLRGRPFVADFIFTRCGGICPAMTARMAQLQKRLPEEIAIVSFTVDPEHDTVDVLARYARDFGADPRWSFVTGPKQALYDLATGGFKLAAMENPKDQPQGDGPFLHSGKFVLVDGDAVIRGYYDSEDSAAIAHLVRDAARTGGS